MKRVTVRAFRGMKQYEENYENEGRNNLTYGEVTTIGNYQVLQHIKNDIPKENGKFLDIGCGYGKLVQFIAEHTNMYCLGVDIDEEKIKIAKQICWSNCSERIHFIYNDIRELPKIVKEADFIFMNSITWNPKLVSAIFQQAEGIIIHNHLNAIKLKNGKWFNYPGEPAPVMCNWGKESQKYYKLNTKDIR
tara:strand:- start:176 stop:748 length:573 start_codon:yes stop_codon:yes gene_type:complete